MSFFKQLVLETEQERAYLMGSPIIARCFEGDIELNDYVNFLTEAYHHVKHTVPLLMTLGGKLTEQQEWLREAVAEYIEEELGHQEWILNDIAACGFDKEATRRSEPLLQTELMVSYAYDLITRIEPVAFFGMVHVLEGTSVTIADMAAAKIKETLNLPNAAFSYLRSHGSLDQEHVKFFENLMDKIDCPKQQQAIIRSAKRFYVLYGNIFRALDLPKQGAAA